MNKNYIYLRKSRMDLELDSNEDVLERHERQLRELAKRKKIYVPEENILKEVVSGESIENRPKMKILLDKIENNEVENILCIEIERLSRGNSIDQGIITQAIVMNKVTIHTLLKTYDTTNEYDEEFFEFGLFMSRREYKTISRRLARGREQAIKEGKIIGAAPFGYDKIKVKGAKGFTLVPNKDAETVKMIFQLYLDGLSCSQIARKLTSLGIESINSIGWQKDSIKYMLKNERYTGHIVDNRRTLEKKLVNNKVITIRKINKNYERIKALHEPIIDDETFKLVQERMKKGSHKVKSNLELKNPLASLLFCAKCKKAMVRRNPKNRAEKYCCRNVQCDNKSSTVDKVEERIIENLKQVLSEHRTYLKDYEEDIILNFKDNTKDIERIDRQLQLLDKQLFNACDFLEKGIYSSELFEQRSSQIKDKKNALIKSKNELLEQNLNDEVQVIKKRIPILELCINHYFDLDIRERNDLLKSIITKIEYERNEAGRYVDKDNFKLKIYL